MTTSPVEKKIQHLQEKNKKLDSFLELLDGISAEKESAHIREIISNK